MFKEKNLVRILKVGVYLSALVPLIIFSQFNSPFHFGKVVVFRILVELMLVFYVALIIQNKSYWPKFNKIIWSFLAFTLAFTLATFTSSQFYQSFWGTLERMGGLFTFWHYFVFFIILASVFRDKKDWLLLFKIMAVVGILSALYGFGQKTDADFFLGGHGRSRIFGTIGNAALFAGYQLLILFLSLALVFKKENTRFEKWLYPTAVIMTAIAVMMTAVRGSILAMVVGWVLFAGIYFWQNKSSAAKKIFLGLIALIVIFIFVAFMLRSSGVITTGYFERITNFSPTNFTVQTRFWTWQAGIDGWNDHLKTIFVGWGPENFNLPFSIHFNPKFYTGPGSETLFDRAHNMFVEVLVTMGVVGFLSYASIFAAIFFTLRKIISQNSEYKYLAMGLVPLTLVYIIHNCFIFDTSANYITFFSILGLVYFISGKNEPVTQISKNRNGLATIVAAVLIILMTVLIYKTDIIPTKANYANTRGIVAGWTGDANPANFAKYFEEAVKKYKESVEYNSFGTYEYRHKIAQYVLDKSNKASAIKNYNEIMLYVVTELEKTATEFPIDYLPRLYLSRLYVTLDKNNNDNDSKYNDLALKYSTEALNLAPNFVRTYYEIGQVYLNKKDYNMASKYFAKAVELNPKVGLSLWYAGIVEFERKNYDVAYDFVGRAIDLGFAMNEQDYNRALNIFIIQGNKARIAQVAEMMVKSYPNSPSQRAVAAVAFARAGMLDKAEEQARAAAKLDKAFEVEAKVFVESLGRQW